MDRRAFIAATASTTLMAVAGCSGDGDGGDGGGGGNGTAGNGTDGNDGAGNETEGDAQTEGDSAAQISIAGVGFDPIRLSVEPGDEVVWTNNSSAAHTVDTRTFHEVAEEWSIDTRTLDAGDAVSHTFEESGVYEYFCAVHGQSNMCGVVLVGDASLDEPLPCEGSVETGGQGANEGSDGNETEGNATTGTGNETTGSDGAGSGNETNSNETSGNESA